MASVFLVKDSSRPEAKTFYHDDKLPSLPVPSVEQTINKYLDSCKAVQTSEEFKKTKGLSDKFVKTEAPILQQKLLERAKEHKNWLEQWWLDKVYLESRIPLPLSNFSGPGTYLEHYWPLQSGTQLERSALGLFVIMKFWEVVRKEMMAAHTFGEGKYFSMHQFRYLFNTCRIPHHGKDELYHGFCTESEGSSPTHIVVLCRGYIFRIEGTDPKTGEISSPAQLYKMFEYVSNICKAKSCDGPGVPSLTSLDREKWADARDHLIEISFSNKRALRDIETSLIVTSLDDVSPRNYTELTYEGVIGDPALRWYDKSYNSATTTNGASLCNCDHTPYDAMVMVALVEFMTFNIKQLKGVWPGSMETNNFVKPTEIQFVLDEQATKYIADAKQHAYALRQNLELLQIVFYKFGKAALKNFKIHPDFMVQLCMQLAYMHVHGKPGPTYETAMTRQFYHGRTETCRTCTPEVVKFCKAVLLNPEPGTDQYRQLYTLLQDAHKKFVSLMADCMENKGCDRHLLGLLFICLENDLPIPELYTDQGFAATGGNGTFVLSTSCVGYFNAQGSVVPMVDNGYGFFYRINDEQLTYSISAYNSCPETSAQRLGDCFEYSLSCVFDLLKRSSYSSKI